MIAKYQKRISGPLMDRIDIHLEVQRVPIAKLASLSSGVEWSGAAPVGGSERHSAGEQQRSNIAVPLCARDVQRSEPISLSRGCVCA